MDPDSTDLVRTSCRRFAERGLWQLQRLGEAAFDPARDLPKLGEMGLFGMTVPLNRGGAGAGYAAYAVAIMEIAAGNAAVSTVMGGQNSVGCMPLFNYGAADQISRYLPAMISGVMSAFALTEPQSGSNASNLMTQARRSENGWVLNGTKQFITGGSTSDIAFVFAVTNAVAGRKGISAFIILTDATGYTCSRIEEKMGQHASDTCELVLKNVELPDSALLGDEGDGYKIALSNLEGGRIGTAAQCVGVARKALELARDYAQERKAFGKVISAYQGVSFRLADMATSLAAAEQLLLHAASLKSAGLKCFKEVSMAKLFAAEVAERVSSDAIQTFGGNGSIKDYGVERLYRDVRVGKIYEGTNDIQRLVIAREMGLVTS